MDLLALRIMAKGVSDVKRSIRDIRNESANLQSRNKQNAVEAKRAGRAMVDAHNAAKRAVDRNTASVRAHSAAVGNMRNAYGSLRGFVVGASGAFVTMYGAARLGLTAIQRFESKQGFLRSLRFNLGNAAAASMLAGKTDAFAQRQGIDIADTRGAVSGLVGTGRVSAKDVIPILRAFTALGGAGGANKEQIGRALEQLKQIASQGQLQGDELRQISENMVPIRKLLTDAGLGGRIGSQTNPITWQEIQKALIDFGNQGNVNQLLAEQANQATASFTRLSNVVNNDILPVIGEVLTPAAKELASGLQEWADGLDPESIREGTQRVVDFGFAVGRAAPYIIGIGVGAKVLQTVLGIRLTMSANAAAASLARLAVAANVASVAQGVGGTGRAFFPNPGWGMGGGGRFIPGVGVGGAGLGLGARLAGYGRAALGGASRLVTGAGGVATGATMLVGGTMLATIALLEKATGMGGEDDSIFSNLMYGGFHQGSADSIKRTKAWAGKADANFVARWAVKRKIDKLRKAYKYAMSDAAIAGYLTPEERSVIGMDRFGNRSPRASAYDSRANETGTRATRNAM